MLVAAIETRLRVREDSQIDINELDTNSASLGKNLNIFLSF